MIVKHRYELVELMKELGLPLKAIELGVAEGWFSSELLDKGIELLYSIDAWQHLNQTGDGGFEQRWHDNNFLSTINLLSNYGERSVVLKGLTSEIAPCIKDNFFGLIYIDAAHDYVNVKRDIECYYPKLVKGGIMGFHDYRECDTYGVIQAVEEFARLEGIKINIIEENHIDDRGAYIIKP